MDALTPGLRKLIDLLSAHYDYVSVLSTDSKGLMLRISQHSKSVGNQTMTTERGTVVRVYRGGLYSEYALDSFDPERPEETAEAIRKTLDAQLELLKRTGVKPFETGKLSDEPLEIFVERETEYLPEDCEISGMVEKFSAPRSICVTAP